MPRQPSASTCSARPTQSYRAVTQETARNAAAPAFVHADASAAVLTHTPADHSSLTLSLFNTRCSSCFTRHASHDLPIPPQTSQCDCPFITSVLFLFLLCLHQHWHHMQGIRQPTARLGRCPRGAGRGRLTGCCAGPPRWPAHQLQPCQPPPRAPRPAPHPPPPRPLGLGAEHRGPEAGRGVGAVAGLEGALQALAEGAAMP